LGILRRIVQASSQPGDVVLDFFAGSGTTGDAARQLGRKFILVDSSPEAIEVMRKRLDTGTLDSETEFRTHAAEAYNAGFKDSKTWDETGDTPNPYRASETA